MSATMQPVDREQPPPQQPRPGPALQLGELADTRDLTPLDTSSACATCPNAAICMRYPEMAEMPAAITTQQASAASVRACRPPPLCGSFPNPSPSVPRPATTPNSTL